MKDKVDIAVEQRDGGYWLIIKSSSGRGGPYGPLKEHEVAEEIEAIRAIAGMAGCVPMVGVKWHQ